MNKSEIIKTPSILFILVPGSMLSLEDMILWHFYYNQYDQKRPIFRQIDVLRWFAENVDSASTLLHLFPG